LTNASGREPTQHAGARRDGEGTTVGQPGDATDPGGGQHEEPASDPKHDAVPDSERTLRAPITKDRVEQCYASAAYWARALPHYADSEQSKADWCSLIAGVAAAITGLGIWPLLGINDGKVTELNPWTLAFSGLALVAAIAALLPRIYNYGEMAGHAREVGTRYGTLVGALEDLVLESPFDPIAARAVVDEFEATKAKKDSLRRLPNRDAEEARWARDRTIRAQADAAATAEELKAVQVRRQLARERAAEQAGQQIAPETAPAEG
jgi:hypothetical protein